MSHAKAIVRTGACAELWSPVLDGLARSFRVIAYDRRGFARSQTTKRWSFSDHARDVALLLEALKAAPATVVGWSGGGVVTLDLAAPSPERVSGLVLAEPGSTCSRTQRAPRSRWPLVPLPIDTCVVTERPWPRSCTAGLAGTGRAGTPSTAFLRRGHSRCLRTPAAPCARWIR